MAARAVPAPLAKLPNALTIVRFALIPVFALLVMPGGRRRELARGRRVRDRGHH